MAQDLGNAVSYVYDDEGYNYDLVVFEKQKPILDSEVNLVQQLQNQINRRQMTTMPSGWVSLYPIHTDKALANQFYTQDPSSPKPEYALVNGQVVYVTNTSTTADNLNIIDLGDAPTTGNLVNGVFLEVWRALLDPNTNINKPDPASIIDTLYGITMYDSNNGWACGQNGLILNTQNGGRTWTVQLVNTTRDLHGISFITSSIGWVVGNNGVIARTSSAGSTWVNLTSPTAENLKSVYAYSQLIAWAVGDSGTILRTTNGVTWLAMVSGTTSNLTKVHFYDALVGWAVGDSGTILKTTNGGITWLQLISGITVNLNSIFFYDLNFGFAVGNNGTILRSSDGGASWVSQSGNIYDGSSYSSISDNLNDVVMVPSLDVIVVDEEVGSQANGTNLTFIIVHTPVTTGDGKGTTSNDPSDVTVKVNGTVVAVDVLDGAAGRIRLVTAPMLCDVVKVTYYYKQNNAVFSGRAWIVGDNGKILRTDNIGATWEEETSGTSYNLYSGSFIDQSKGWIAGANSVIQYTDDGGVTWTAQQSEIVAREVQRVYKEGNTETSVFLNENTIHPDASVETTKRVQLQYKIRVVRSVDPDSNPEAGLSSAIYGEGPGTGLYPYQNMGSTTGDYGLWRAKCLNTVDGYVYAIPMFFVNRRNIQAFNAQSNANGQHVAGTFVRPDLLTATMVVDGDILDVRRKVLIPSVSELFETGFDLLSKTELSTTFGHVSSGGDRFGKELLQIDRISGLSSDGGTQIPGNLTEAVNGLISSEVSLLTRFDTTAATTTVPTELSLPLVAGLYHQNPVQYNATYVSTSSVFGGKSIPGYWSSIGSSQPKFVFSTSANSQLTDPLLTDYLVTGPEVRDSTSSLTHIPATPMLVKNTSGAGSSNNFFYQGVLDTQNRVIEQWDSGISGYQSYALAYPGADSSSTDQQYRASTVELHYFTRASSSGTPVKIDSSNILAIDFDIPGADSSDVSKYVIGSGSAYATSVSKINNITSGFSYKIDHITVTDKIRVYSVSGYPFIEGATLEIVAGVLSAIGDNNVRNGATVNFSPGNKKIRTFCNSIIAYSSNIILPTATVPIPVLGGVALGASTTETTTSLTQYVCWKSPGTTMYPVQISGFGTSTLTLTFSTTVTGIFSIQVLVGQTALPNPDDIANDGLQIAYTYLPSTGIIALPSSVSMDIVEVSPSVYVSTLGSGGSGGEPYSNPMEFIPTNNSTILNDGFFSNYDKLRFSSFSVDSGFVSMPATIPKKFSDTITLSSLTVDNMNRPFYSACSEQFEVSVEGLQMAIPRKVYLPVLARIKDPTSTIFMTGEYVLVVFCRTFMTETTNSTGFISGNHDSIAVYRLPNRPMSRI